MVAAICRGSRFSAVLIVRLRFAMNRFFILLNRASMSPSVMSRIRLAIAYSRRSRHRFGCRFFNQKIIAAVSGGNCFGTEVTVTANAYR